MANEIGSEFWESSDTGKKKYLISGRAALEYIICDILGENDVSSVLMPSYCCHTMIEPFVRHGIDIRFYDVFFEKGKGLCVELPVVRKKEENNRKAIFYYMTYFGFSNLHGLDLENGMDSYSLFIEDQTHSWLQEGISPKKGFASYYAYTSFRKWTGLYGIAEARKSKSAFTPDTRNAGEEYSDQRKEAMHLKGRYMERQDAIAAGDIIPPVDEMEYAQKCKREFLEKYSDAEECLEKDYVGYLPTPECVWQFLNTDWDYIREQRRKNADALLRSLREIPEITLIFEKREMTDTPLFVPVLLDTDRDGLRKYLINHQVYCPVHWPLSDYHNGISERGQELYGKELSLVCDQRYREEDMAHISRLIKEYFSMS